MEKVKSLGECIGGQCAQEIPTMRSYIGAKIIRAVPMTDLDFEVEVRIAQNAKNTVKAYQRGEMLLQRHDNYCSMEPREARQGYKVMYPDGYMSWSPKNVFEQAYRIISKEESMLI